MRAILYTLSLLILWLLMSGVYEPLTIGFGVLSAILVVWIIAKLGILGTRRLSDEVSLFKFCKYIFWLIIEIGKADWAVTKVILSPKQVVRQRLLSVPASQQSDFGKMLYANSITITPGTITVETEPNQFIIHALTDAAADLSALEEMGNRVCSIENRDGEPM